MAPAVTLHVHCFAWHDADRLAAFLRHHEPWAERIFVWNLEGHPSGIDDRMADPNITLRSHRAAGNSLIDHQRQLFDSVWKASRGRADWVLLLNADEHLYHPDLPAHLARCAAEGVTALSAIGYEMISDRSPTELNPEVWWGRQITQGVRSPGLDRLLLFAPSAITETHFSPGLHHAWPEGHVVWPRDCEMQLLRFQMLGESHYLETARARAGDLLPGDHEQRWSCHWTWSEEAMRRNISKLKQQAKTLPGHGSRADIPPSGYRGEEKVIEASGLFDAEWYSQQYPDIAAHLFDPITHYCEYGWQEGRQPNPYFDGAWYTRTYAAELSDGRNPLLHYIERGERENAWPSPHFDPEWYRDIQGLNGSGSPLRHYLEHRLSGKVSPLPSFDVEVYLEGHPGLLEQGMDPYQHFLQTTPAAAAPVADAPAEDEPEAAGDAPATPSWEDVLATLADYRDAEGALTAVPLEALQAAVLPFVGWLPFDADWYLQAYPDVAEAISMGVFESAHAHFVEHGFFEGRAPIAAAEPQH